ncbi:MAG: tyrosine-type recombinase/integrase [Acidimicrobiia bacterium]
MGGDETEALLTSWGLALHDHAQSTRALYADAVRRFARWLPEGRSLLDVTRPDAEAYFADQRDRGLAQATIRSRWIALRSFYGWLLGEDEIPASPLTKVNVGRAEPPPPDVPADDALELLFKSLAGRDFYERRDLAMVRVAAATGLRIGELCALEVGDVDLRTRTLLVRHGKGDRPRLARMDPATGAVLDRYLRARARHRLAHLGALWLSRFGPFGRKGAMAMLKRRCEHAGVPAIRWHQLRHRFAHAWLRAGGQEGDLARLGGWTDPAIMRRYGSALASERALDAYDELGGVL